jgi:hypothetical protein
VFAPDIGDPTYAELGFANLCFVPILCADGKEAEFRRKLESTWRERKAENCFTSAAGSSLFDKISKLLLVVCYTLATDPTTNDE